MDFHKLGMCIVIVEIWFWIANGLIFDRIICPSHDSSVVLSFHIFISLQDWLGYRQEVSIHIVGI